MSVHDLTVTRFAATHPLAGRRGFARMVRKVFADSGDEAPALTFIPDLWWHESGAITCIEVEDENPISSDKLRAYCQLWFDLDSVNCELRLLTANRCGKLTPIPLGEYHWAAWGKP